MPAPLPLQSVNHLARVTRHLDESRAFYRDVLGFLELRRPDFEFRGAWLLGLGLQIHLIEGSDGPSPDREISTRSEHLALHVDDLPAVERLLKEHGVPFRTNVSPVRNVTQIFFHDPDGYHIEVACYPAVEGVIGAGRAD